MEDTYFFKLSNQITVFGVLDGHNGRSVVEYVTNNLQRKIMSSLSEAGVDDSIEEILKDVFLSMDNEVREHLPESSTANTGATCSVCVIRVENGQKVLYTANIGDTKGYLYEKSASGVVTQTELTETHRADKPSELARVKSSGSYVSLKRIEGRLEVSRGFGDFSFKKKGFIAEPTISRRLLGGGGTTANCVAAAEKITANLVLASDGLWDFASTSDISEIVEKSFDSANVIACNLKNLAKRARSTDNITVMTVSIHL